MSAYIVRYIQHRLSLRKIFPGFIDALNFYRNIKGRWDLLLFLYKWDSDYRKDLIITFLAYTLLAYSLSTWDDFYDIIAIGIEITIIAVQLGGELSILPADYKPKHGGVIYTADTSRHVLYGEESFSMAEIQPAPSEAALGFINPIEDFRMCPDTPLVSSRVDDEFMLRDKIPWVEEKGETNYIYSRHQLRYIAIKIANKKQHTTNGELLAFFDLADSLVGDNTITVRKTSYFDYLLTMEAFRSRIYRGNLNGDKEVYTDMTTYFPVKRDKVDGHEVLRFKSGFHRQVSNLIGITSLLLTENNRVAMMFQGSNKVIGSNTVYLGGSGSLDYKDLEEMRSANDFREIIKYGMAREACEETGMMRYFKTVRENTMVTGFFRWIDRCGLPEFVGITRASGVPFMAEKSIDGDEVVKFEEVPIEIKVPEDFQKVLDYLLENNHHVTLSSLMALHRVVVIGGYNTPEATEQQKAIYQQLADFVADK